MNGQPVAVRATPQWRCALERANHVRLARSALRHRIAKGELEVGAIVLACPEEAMTMTIAELLRSQHRWGRTRTRKFLAHVPVSEAKTVGSLTDRQRQTIVAQLNG